MRLNKNASPLNFKADISPQVMRRINLELSCTDSKRYAKSIVSQKLEELPEWGPKGSELIISRNIKGNKCLGLKMPLDNGFVVSWPIEYLKGKTILSQVMNLHASHLDSTEKTINFLYSKYGLDVFEKSKNAAPHVR